MTQGTPERSAALPRRSAPWVAHPLTVAEGWGAFVLRQRYPVVGDRHAYKQMFEALLNHFSEVRSSTQAEAFLQMDRLDFRNDVPVVQQHSDILGDYGLGIYPEGGPPTTWTKEEFLDKMAPEKLRPLAFDVMLVDAGPEAVAVIRSEFLGSGAYTEAHCADGARFYQQATSQWRPAITDPILRTFPYHAPLLTRRALESADAGTLERWSCGALLYLRESIEDDGLLVLQRGDIQPVLDRIAQGSLLASPAGEAVR